MNIWFTSDTHYGHKNLVAGTTEWTDTGQCRDFKTIEEHDYNLVKNINNCAKYKDILYHTGDWSFGGKESIKNFMDRLECRNIHLVLGNHDVHIEKGVCNDLFTSVNQIIDKKIGGNNIVLCHYAMRTWHKAHRGSWMLYGHSHGNLHGFDNYKTMDIGVDTHPEFRPYHIDEIRKIMDKKEILPHH